MKLSQFTVVVNDYPKPDQHLLYNTLSRALIKVDKSGMGCATKPIQRRSDQSSGTHTPQTPSGSRLSRSERRLKKGNGFSRIPQPISRPGKAEMSTLHY